MRCDEFEQILEQELNEPYLPAAADHLESCEQCRTLAAELGALRMAGHALSEQDAEELEVPERVWIALRNQLEEEGLIRETDVVAKEARLPWWSFAQRPALAGLVLSVIVLAGLLAGYQKALAPDIATLAKRQAPGSPTAAPAALDVSEELQNALNDTVSALPAQDAVLADSLRRDLAIIDSSIAMCEKSVHEQPQNEMAREYLYGAYQQKAELLELATYRSVTGGLQ